ncbi:hypothetical protein EDB19DRAFT_1917550 [Suillus lakei]|nr:hypothetical protein EDB19DRAFT_1917550 [Suillus lakei]
MIMYIDVPEPILKGKGGHPGDPRLTRLAIRCHKKDDPKKVTTVKFHDLDETIFSQEIDGNESEAGDGYNEDSDAWLDGTIDLVDEDDPGYLCCSNQVFVHSEDARLDGPELLDLLSDKAIEMGAQNQLQTPGPSSEVVDSGPVAWKFSFSQTL